MVHIGIACEQYLRTTCGDKQTVLTVVAFPATAQASRLQKLSRVSAHPHDYSETGMNCCVHKKDPESPDFFDTIKLYKEKQTV